MCVGVMGVGRMERMGGWVNDTSRHSWPSCVHSGPDRWPQQPWPYHEPSRHTVEHNLTTSYPVNAPQWLHRVCFGPSWLDKVDKRSSVKADLPIYSSFVTVSGQCMSVDIIISNKMDFNFCMYMEGFHKSSHI